MHHHSSIINRIYSVLAAFALLLCFGASLFAQSKSLIIEVQPAAGMHAKLLGFDVFKTDTLANAALDKKGNATMKINYTGLGILAFSNGKEYPVIIKNETTTFSLISFDSLPVFPNEEENTFLYKYLIMKRNLANNTSIVNKSLSSFTTADPYNKALTDENKLLAQKNKDMQKAVKAKSKLIASTLLQATFLMESSNAIKTEAEMKSKKKDFISFIQHHYTVLHNSDMLGQLAMQYVIMSDNALIVQDADYTQLMADIGKWIKEFGDRMNGQQIVNFYLNYFLERSKVGITGKIVEKYPKLSMCTLPAKTLKVSGDTIPDCDVRFSMYGGSTTKLKNISDSSKILYFFRSDCPACYSQQPALMRFIQDRGYPMPVVTVFSDTVVQQSLNILIPLQKDQFSYTQSNTLFEYAGVEQFPAYVVISKKNIVLKRFYNLEDLRNYIVPPFNYNK